MIQIRKLLSITTSVIRVGENVIDLPSKLAAKDYLGVGADVISILTLCWAWRDFLRKAGGRLLTICKNTIRYFAFRFNRSATEGKKDRNNE